MDATKERYEQIVRELLTEYAQIPHLQETLNDETIFDLESGRFMLVTIGWQNGKRVNTIVLHLDVTEDHIWIQCNNTDQDIKAELVQRGISETQIIAPAVESSTPDSTPENIAELALA